MDMVPLASATRSSTGLYDLRSSGKVPCVLYGNESDNVSLECEHGELHRVYRKAGESTVVELDTGSKKVPVLIHAIDRDPVTSKIIHVDFYAVNLKKEIEATVPIHFEGQAPAVKDMGGILITPRQHITVRCLPTILPHSFTIDLSVLQQFGDSLTISDLELIPGVYIADESETVIALVQEPRKEEEIETPTETAEATEGTSAEGGDDSDKEGDEKKDEEQSS